MTNYAVLETKTAELASDFGLEWATKLFGEEAIASLPVFSRGAKKGKTKGHVIWRKVIKGGWSQDHGVLTGGIADAWIAGSNQSPRGAALRGQWLGRIQELAGPKNSLFEEGRQRFSAELQRIYDNDFAELKKCAYSAGQTLFMYEYNKLEIREGMKAPYDKFEEKYPGIVAEFQRGYNETKKIVEDASK